MMSEIAGQGAKFSPRGFPPSMTAYFRYFLGSSRGRVALQAVLLFLAAVWLYWPSRSFEFTLDDALVTRLNTEVATAKPGYLGFFLHSLYHGTPIQAQNDYLYRPLVLVSLALQHQLAGGFDPFLFHLANILLYGVTVVAVFFFYRAVFIKPAKPGTVPSCTESFYPFCAAALFLVFPSHLESVCNVKHREELLACLFGMASWVCVLRLPRAWGAWLGGLFFLAALLCKESAVLLLPCMLLWEFLQGRLGSLSQAARTPLVSLVVATGLYGVLRWNALGVALSQPGARMFFLGNDGVLTRASVSAWIFCRYYLFDQVITQQLDPAFSSRLLLFEGGQPNPGSLSALVALVVLIVLTVFQACRARQSLAHWGLFFFLTSALSLNLVPTGTAGAFRLMFTPSVFLCALPVLLAQRFGPYARKSGATFKTCGVVLLCCVCIFYGMRVRARMEVWKSDGALFGYSAGLAPGNALSAYAAGQYFETLGDLERKNAFYERALALFMKSADSEQGFDERTRDAFSVVATENAFRLLDQKPEEALALAEEGIHQFDCLQIMRSGGVDTNITAPYYVKALALIKLGKVPEAADACRAGLRYGDHPGLRSLLSRTQP
jgi:tetratricopeptide (TPR) repeat protein